jgi:hypothetical protein
LLLQQELLLELHLLLQLLQLLLELLKLLRRRARGGRSGAVAGVGGGANVVLDTPSASRGLRGRKLG